jgi:hypothetical protein
MFKRTKGYFLLTMLVLTGLAGRLHSDTLTARERHYLATELKASKTELLQSIAGLSNKQLNFTPRKSKLSIKDCIYKLASIEENLWTSAKISLQQEDQFPQKTITNDNMLVSVAQQQLPVCSKEVRFNNVDDALKLYKSQRTQMLRYVQTSTENVRMHVAKTAAGNFDAYQLILLNTLYTHYYVQQIEQIKSNPKFRK